MSQWISFASGGGSPSNLNTTYEEVGFGSGDGTTITTTSPAHTKGAYAQLVASTANDWAGFWIVIGGSSSAAGRFLIDISLDGGSTVAIPNLFTLPGAIATGQGPMFFVPLNVPAGSDVQVRAQSGTATQSFRIAMMGAIRNATSRPLYNTCTAISAADTTATFPGSTSIPLTNTWAEMNPSTSATYGAVMANFGATTAPGTAQLLSLAIGYGASTAEVEMIRTICAINTSSPTFRGCNGLTAETSIPSGTRMVCRAYGGTPGSDFVVGQLFGFS